MKKKHLTVASFNFTKRSIAIQLTMTVINKRISWGVEAKTKKPVVSQQIFIQKALSQKRKVCVCVCVGGGGGGGSIHFLKALFKTYSKINVWWLLLSE